MHHTDVPCNSPSALCCSNRSTTCACPFLDAIINAVSPSYVDKNHHHVNTSDPNITLCSRELATNMVAHMQPRFVLQEHGNNSYKTTKRREHQRGAAILHNAAIQYATIITQVEHRHFMEQGAYLRLQINLRIVLK